MAQTDAEDQYTALLDLLLDSSASPSELSKAGSSSPPGQVVPDNFALDAGPISETWLAFTGHCLAVLLQQHHI